MGFSAEAATLLEFPVTMFDPGSDLTPLKENIDKVVEGLTKWQPAVKAKGISPPPLLQRTLSWTRAKSALLPLSRP